MAAACLALSTAACSGGDDDDTTKEAAPVCPTGTTATTVELTQLAPATGASVTNSMIVHTFQTVGVDARLPGITLAALPTHTAGAIPEFTASALPIARAGGTGTDYLYSFTVTWPTAPAHVALTDPSLYESPSDGCRFQLPSPLFEYDITL